MIFSEDFGAESAEASATLIKAAKSLPETAIALIFSAAAAWSLLTYPIRNPGESETPPATSMPFKNTSDSITSAHAAEMRRYLSRDDILAADWPLVIRETWVPEKMWGWGRFLDYELQRDTPGSIAIRGVGALDAIRFSTSKFLPGGAPPVGPSEQAVFPTTVLASTITGKLYAFFTFGTTHLGGAWGLYESDYCGRNASEMLLMHQYRFPESFRFSPDGTTLAFSVDNTEFALNESTNQSEQIGNWKVAFHVVDLFDPRHNVSFQIPGNLDQYIREKHLNKADSALAANWVAAWQFTRDGSIEFTRYFARGTVLAGYAQQSSKELWSYNQKSGSMTLLDSVPFKDSARSPNRP